ncbi:MAG: hypothetical protein GY841_19620 [FCB group bacterium]|nr:hypothetical protein [FCB group bacterium]
MGNNDPNTKDKQKGLPWQTISAISAIIFATITIHVGLWQFGLGHQSDLRDQEIRAKDEALNQRILLSQETEEWATRQAELVAEERDSLSATLDSIIPVLTLSESQIEELEQTIFHKTDQLNRLTEEILALSGNMDDCEEARADLLATNDVIIELAKDISTGILPDLTLSRGTTRDYINKLETQKTAIDDINSWSSSASGLRPPAP